MWLDLFAPTWLKGIPEHLRPNSKRQIEQLEALRVLEGIPDSLFRNEILGSPPLVRKHLYELKKHFHNPDERKVWSSVVRFWVESLTRLGVTVELSEADILMLVKTASNFDHICDRIIEITPDSTPDPLDVAKQMGGDYGVAIMAAYQGRDHADQIKARIAELLS